MGGDGDDTLMGDDGDDYLDGGKGNDTYWLRRGDGHDTIISDSNKADDSDTVQLGENITTEDIQLSRYNQDLVISIFSTADSMRVKNYYVQDSNTTKRLLTNDGKEISLTAVNLLTDLMAGFNTDHHAVGSENQYQPDVRVTLPLVSHTDIL